MEGRGVFRSPEVGITVFHARLATNHFLCKIENSILVHSREILCEVHSLSLILYSLFFVAIRGIF